MSNLLLGWIVINVSFVPMAYLWRHWIPPRQRFVAVQLVLFLTVWGITVLLFGNRYDLPETGFRSFTIPVLQQVAAYLFWRFGRGAPKDH